MGVNDYFLGKCSLIVGDNLTTKARRCDILTTKVRMTNLQKWPTRNTFKNWSHVNIFRTQLQVLDSFPWKLLFLALLSVFSVHCSKTSTKYITIREGGRGVRGGLILLLLPRIHKYGMGWDGIYFGFHIMYNWEFYPGGLEFSYLPRIHK